MNDELKRLLEEWELSGKVAPDVLEKIEELQKSGRRTDRDLGPLLYLLRVDAQVDTEALDTIRPSSTASEQSENEPIDVAEDVMLEIGYQNVGPTERRFGRRPSWQRSLVAIAAAAVVMFGTVFGVLRSGLLETGPKRIIVQFELSAPEAESVALVGDFNQWEPDSYELVDPDGDGVWEIEVELEQDRVYTYNFLIDDSEWISDPMSNTRVQDSFGGEKSVLNL